MDEPTIRRSELREEELVVTEPQQQCFLVWRKSSASGAAGCVEVARAGEMILVRDSKNISGSALKFSGAEWRAFLVGARAGEFNI